MKVNRIFGDEDRMKIAEQLVLLSGGILQPVPNSKYIALKVGSRNAATVRKNRDRVSFYLSTMLLGKAEKFGPKKAPHRAERDKNWHWFEQLTLSDIQSDESLFKEIVEHSMSEVAPRKNSR
jgi:hypothetical protein